MCIVPTHLIHGPIEGKTPKSLLAVFLLPLSVWLPKEVSAQIVPDPTLPNHSIVTVEEAIDRITGGTQAGGNLFHSFEQFNLQTGETAFFDNALTIDNIITRVTGGQPSNIDGSIQANGAANLFLLNPSGILFGPNASLEIGGSFLGSSADGLLFEDGSIYSATDARGADGSPPLLSVNVPIGLQLGANPGPIVHRSQVTNDMGQAMGLQVQPTQTLTLIGGDLALEGGHLSAPDGTIALVSGRNEAIVLNDPFFTTTTVPTGTLQLTQQASVNTSGLGGGTIQVRSGEISLEGGSRLVADTFGSFDGGGIEIESETLRMQDGAFVSASTFGEGSGGGIVIRTGLLDITGTRPTDLLIELTTGSFNPLALRDGLFSFSAATGQAGNMTIDAQELRVRNQVGILTSTFVAGPGGNLLLRVPGSAEFRDNSVLLSGTAGAGNSGDLTLEVGQLRAINNIFMATVAGPVSQGDAGNLNIVAETIEIRGVGVGVGAPGGFHSTSLGAGDAGDLTLNADGLVLAGGGQVAASTAGAGLGGNLTVNASSIEMGGRSEDGRFLSGFYTSSGLVTLPGQGGNAPAGNLTVNADRLSVRDGAQISAATGTGGAAGSLTVNVSEAVEVSGVIDGVAPSVESVSFGFIGDGIVPSAIEANTSGAGNAGDLSLQTGRLVVSDRAEVGVRGISSGAAGNLNVVAETIELDDEGSVTAATLSGTGGNINLQAANIQMRRGGRIATDAGNADGGNITIATETLVALENSDISANAQQGRGGRVSITAQGIFLSPDSDITATSELGTEFSGVVSLQTPEVDPSAGLVELPEDVNDPANQVVAGCSTYANSRFVVTGQGGLPEDPTEVIRGQTVWRDWQDFSQGTTVRDTAETPQSLMSFPSPMVEATGWIINEQGKVELVAHLPQEFRGGQLPQNCQSIKN